MTELLEITRNNRSNSVARIGGFPCGNMAAAGSGVRFRASGRHENVAFMNVLGRR